MENAPKGIITPDEAKTMDQLFTARCELISERILKRQDNRSCWWSLEEMENFIAYAKQQTKELGHEMNGIRIYMGAYPEGAEGPGYSTMFLVPTADIPEGKDGSGSGAGDVPGANALNGGTNGIPPGGNYPQN